MKPYRMPALLFVASLIGLVTMLMVDNAVGDNLGLLLLILPLAVLVRVGFVTPPARR